MIIDTSFKWFVAGDYLIEDDRPASRRKRRASTILGPESSGRRLIARGAVMIKRPLKLDSRLDLRLLNNCEQLGFEEGIRVFARRYGMLTQDSQPGDWEPLWEWEALVRSLKQAIRRSGPKTTIVNMHAIKLVRDRDKMALTLIPGTLRNAIMLQTQFPPDTAEVVYCRQCGTAFVRARRDQVYCSKDCRWQHAYQRRQ